jgi:hypothetical protein
MALFNSTIVSVAVMLDAIPTLTGELAVHRVPVIFVGERRFDGPMTEWVLAQRLIQVRESSAEL